MKKLVVFCFLFFASYHCASTQNAFNEPETQFRRLFPFKKRDNFDFPCPAGKERISDGTCVSECQPGQVRVGDYCNDIDRNAFVRAFISLFNRPEIPYRRLFPIKSRGNSDFPCTAGKVRTSGGTCVPECRPGQVRVEDYCTNIDRSSFVRAFISTFNKPETPYRKLFPIKSRGNFDLPCPGGEERLSDGTCVPGCPPGQSRADDGTCLDEE